MIYRPLDATALRAIVEMKLAQVAKRLNKHYGLQCTIEESLYDTLVAACLLPDTARATSIACSISRFYRC
nr:hypothetical protein [Yersinia kristensenii]